MKSKCLSVLIGLTLAFGVGGCATVETVSNFTNRSPKLYSGTRLDWTALTEDELRLRVYKETLGVDPPGRPGADLVFSFLLDTLILPVTVPVALSEAIFD